MYGRACLDYGGFRCLADDGGLARVKLGVELTITAVLAYHRCLSFHVAAPDGVA